MYLGWGSLGGVEAWNNQRVHQYAANYLPGLMRNCECGCDAPQIAEALGDAPYRGPHHDRPDWYDTDDLRSANFLGVHALGWVGMEDSTRETITTETLGDGGVIGLSRLAMKQVRVTALLVATDEAGLDYGMAWFKKVLAGEACSDDGDQFCFFATCPEVCSDSPNLGTGQTVQDCVTANLRYLRRVAVQGPRVMERMSPTRGALARVEFVMTAARPFIYGEPVQIASSGSARSPVTVQTNRLKDPSSYLTQFTSLNTSATSALDTSVGQTSGRSTRQTLTVASTTILWAAARNNASNTAIACVAGDTWKGVVNLRTTRSGRRGTASLRFYSGATLISEVLGLPLTLSSSGSWREVPVTGVVPAGATSVVLVGRVTSASGVAPIGEQAWMTDAALERTTADFNFFSGASPNSADGLYQHAWDGVANASTSRRQYVDYDVLVWQPGAQVLADVAPRECGTEASLLSSAGSRLSNLRRIVDPQCPPLPAPPIPPTVANTCVQDVNYVTARAILIPSRVLPEWADGVPILEMASSVAVRSIRIRFYAAPLEQAYSDVDSCGYCGEFIVSYLPARTTLKLDGMTQTAVLRGIGDVDQPARHLLYGTDGAPFEWPVLSCGTAYWVTLDSPAVIDRISKFTVSVTTRE